MTMKGSKDSDPRRSQLLRGVLDLCLLALVAERPRYGFEIVEGLAERGMELVSEGSIYPLLARMEKAGLLESFRRPSESGGAPRKYYRLTGAGLAELGSGRAAWEEFARSVGRTLSVEVEIAEGTNAEGHRMTGGIA
ncbi:PadR family transcriptional regulator [Streptomyces sp. UNOC14_S4]|uniref:PadR family transcriptional regulator n=1 Tax=Streptomyces sp. UNOC14_S4 TaxID=2872340 RepID=UPI001E644C21|nr:PadR family transcriptional regulator [Streptomyces sp. UNOC14_S4]